MKGRQGQTQEFKAWPILPKANNKRDGFAILTFFFFLIKDNEAARQTIELGEWNAAELLEDSEQLQVYVYVLCVFPFLSPPFF